MARPGRRCAGCRARCTRTCRAPSTTEPVGYTLAPYLAQLGRADRETELPPASFWQAVQRCLPPTAWAVVARHADRYGLHRIGARLRKAALTVGVSAKPAELLRRVPNAGADVVSWLVHNSPVTDLRDIWDLSRALVERDARVTLLRRTAAGTDLSGSTELGWLLDELAKLGDTEAIEAFLARDPGRTLPMDGSLLPALVILDRPAGELFADRLLTENTVLNPWTVELLAKAGLRDAVRTAVHDIAPPSDTDDFIKLLEVLYNNGFGEEVRRLLAPGLPVPAQAWEAADLIHVLNGLGRRDEVLALVDRINVDERMLVPVYWSGLLERLPGYARDRLRLPAPGASTGPKKTLSLDGLEDDGEKEFRGLSQLAAEAAVAVLDPADGPKVRYLLQALRLDGHTGPRAALVRRIDPARVVANETVLCRLAEELGPGPQSRAILTRVLAGIGPWYSKFNRRVVIPALQATGADDLLTRLAERIGDAGNFDAYLTLVPAQQATYRYGREPDKSSSAPWSWASLP